MLDAEADQLCGAGRYERSQARQDTRAGSYERTLQTSAGEVSLKVPKLRRQTFETAIIERYRRRESSVEEALIEMYLAGVSVRRVEDITEALWGTRVSPSTVSNLNKKIYAKIEAWRNRRIEGEHPYLYLDGIVMKRTWAGEVRNVSLLVASAVNSEGFGRFWHLRRRQGGQVGLVGVPAAPGRSWAQGRAAHHLRRLPRPDGERRRVSAGRTMAALHGAFYRNVFSHVPATRVREVSHSSRPSMPRRTATRPTASSGDCRRPAAARMNTAADLVERSVHETLTYYAFPDIHWQKIRTNNPLERIMKDGGAPASSAHSPRPIMPQSAQLDYATSLTACPPSAT